MLKLIRLAVPVAFVVLLLVFVPSCASMFSPPPAAPPVIVNNTTQGGDGGMTVALVVFAFLALALVAVAIVALMRLVERNRQCAEAEKARDRLADQLVSLGHLPAINGYSYGYNARQALQAHVLPSERQQELR